MINRDIAIVRLDPPISDTPSINPPRNKWLDTFYIFLAIGAFGALLTGFIGWEMNVPDTGQTIGLLFLVGASLFGLVLCLISFVPETEKYQGRLEEWRTSRLSQDQSNMRFRRQCEEAAARYQGRRFESSTQLLGTKQYSMAAWIMRGKAEFDARYWHVEYHDGTRTVELCLELDDVSYVQSTDGNYIKFGNVRFEPDHQNWDNRQAHLCYGPITLGLSADLYDQIA